MTRLSPQLDSQASSRHKAAEAALEKHDLTGLFIQQLEWVSLLDRTVKLPSLLATQKQCIPIACRKETVVWKVQIAADTALTSLLKEQIYSEIVQLQAEWSADLDSDAAWPLVIFVDSLERRSLWCQAAGFQKQSQSYLPQSIQSALYVLGQPVLLWRFRLERLRSDGQGLFRSYRAQAYSPFKLLLEQLCKGITGISTIPDRQNYAALTLQRLILIQLVQQKGWMNGDTWYIQTRFGEHLQAKNNFFAACLQPLYQCLALPAVERPVALSEQMGTVPFLGHLFHTHRLDQKYEHISIENQAFEQILGWLSEQANTDGFNLWTNGDLGYCLERYLGSENSVGSQCSETARALEDTLPFSCALAKPVSDRALNQFITNRMQSFSHDSHLTDINDLLFNAEATAYRHLVQSVLPDLRILDPACGSGNLLVEVYQTLIELFCNLMGYGQQTQDAQLRVWQTGLVEEANLEQKRSPINLLQSVQKHVLKNILYGVDISMQAVEISIFQLLLHTVTTALHPQDIEPLIDLSFNMLVGNSLIGLIDVDKERFENVQTGDHSMMQGNLLQALVAESYQTILAEKNLAVEHYKSRNQTLAEARNIPDYARVALLKEEILRLDINAQQKLDRLLLNQMSQQLGIQYKAAQLAQKPQRRPLTLEDIDILQPFHWGYHFNTILAKGGFDIVICAPPQSAFMPTASEFLQKFRDLAEVKGLSVRSLKTSKQALAKGDAEIAEAWLFYQDQYAYVADYFYRSEQYEHQNPKTKGKTVRNQLSRERLFVEQCFNLLAKKGLCAAVLSERLSHQPKAQALYSFLEEEASIVEQRIEPLLGKGAIAIIQKEQPA